MAAIAIGRFDDNIIGLGDIRGVSHNGAPSLTQVAGKNYLAFFPQNFQIDLEHGGTKNMAGIKKTHRHPRHYRNTLLITHGAKKLEAVLDII
ncbi:MAG: hypothetical protein DDT35_01322 [Firmicutes bacterium]|nr:hypothetical protein [Bacillota bacterium]